MNYENQRSNLYKELNESFWNTLLDNPTFKEICLMVVAGLFVGVLMLWAVMVGH